MKTKRKDVKQEAAPVSTGLGALRGDRWIIAAFIIPFVLMTAAFAVMKVSPFGDKQILVTDLWQQYYPFLVDFQSKLKNGGSLFWSWTQGGGVNYFALMSYYLAGPVNFLTALVPSVWLREFLMFSVAARVACAGMFMAIFLRSVYKRDDISLVIFSCCFSFCAFFMGYYWNTIWLDAVCLTPLVALGTVKLLTEKRFRLYTVTLTLSLLANYYIGLFTCIFVLLLFIVYHILHWEGFPAFGRNLLRTAVFSLIAIGMTAFFLLPAYFALGNTHATASTFPAKFAINIGETNDIPGVLSAMRQVASNFLTFAEPSTAAAEALPNIACGTASIVFGMLFFTNRKISVRERVVTVTLIVFMLLSCVIRQLDYIWHGFHFTNMVPYRFTYLISFLLVAAAYRAFLQLDQITPRHIVTAAAFTTLLILCGIGVQRKAALIGAAVLAVILFGLLYLYTRQVLTQKRLLLLFAALVIAESGATAYIGVKTTRVTSTENYPRGEAVTADVIAHMKELERDTPEIWRAEVTSIQTLNDSSLNGYNGLTMFSSMANEQITRFYENFGMMGRKSGNRYGYAESSPVTNTFLNLKYLISRDGSYSNTYDLTEVYEKSGEKLLRSEHYIPMGFMVNSALAGWGIEDDKTEYNPFDKQNEFFRLATGLQEDVYSPLDVVNQGHSDHENFPVYKQDYGKYTYDYTELDGVPKLKWNYEAPRDGMYCMYADIDGSEKVTIMVNDTAQTPTYNIRVPYIACIGQFHKGDKISVCSDLEQGTSGSATVYVDQFHEDVFERGHAVISRDVMTTSAYTGNSLQGTIDVKESGLFYTSIPYEEGWTASVDGKKTEITPVGGALIAFQLPEGTHSIELSFYPKGFQAGCVVCAVCLVAFAAACVKMRKREEN